MSISVAVISYNTKAILAECLSRLRRHNPDAELVVVDVGSTDGSPEMVAADFSEVKLVRAENRGYAYAVNRGVEAASGDFVAEMNSDVYLERGDLDALHAALEQDPRAAFAGPVLVTPEGKPQSFGPFYAPNYWNLTRPRPVSWLSGALVLARREALKDIGGMDERFFFYNEDLEWGFRARRKGWRNLLVPRRVLHLGGSSTPSDPRFIAEGYRGGLLFTELYYPWLSGLHKKAVRLEALLRQGLEPDPVRREGYSRLLEALDRPDRPLS